MKKVLCLLVFGLLVCFSATAKVNTSRFPTKSLSSVMKEYIQQNYQVTQNKKLVLYEPSFFAPNCPYVQAFIKAFQKQRRRGDLTEYSFQPQILTTRSFETEAEADREGKRLLSFVQECGAVCIVSLQNNWIYSIKNPGIEEARTLPRVFSSFKEK